MKVLDLESRLEQADHQSIKLWLRLLTTCNLIENEIRSRLQAEFGISLARFDFLAQLERVPEGMRMSDLSARLMVTKGNITGLADQLELEDFIERQSGADRRSTLLRLTDSGRERFAHMAKVHETWVIELLLGLGSGEQKQLGELLGKAKSHIKTGLEP